MSQCVLLTSVLLECSLYAWADGQWLPYPTSVETASAAYVLFSTPGYLLRGRGHTHQCLGKAQVVCVCEGKMTTLGNVFFLPHVDPRDQTQVIKFGANAFICLALSLPSPLLVCFCVTVTLYMGNLLETLKIVDSLSLSSCCLPLVLQLGEEHCEPLPISMPEH